MYEYFWSPVLAFKSFARRFFSHFWKGGRGVEEDCYKVDRGGVMRYESWWEGVFFEGTVRLAEKAMLSKPVHEHRFSVIDVVLEMKIDLRAPTHL
jgi:hypothetical protein